MFFKYIYLLKSYPAAYCDPFTGAYALSDNFANFNIFPSFITDLRNLCNFLNRLIVTILKKQRETNRLYSPSSPSLPRNTWSKFENLPKREILSDFGIVKGN